MQEQRMQPNEEPSHMHQQQNQLQQQMSHGTLIIAGFLNLPKDEQRSVFEYINSWQKDPDSVLPISMGPLDNDRCVVCGK